MSIDGQGTLWRRNIGENFNRLSRAHERYRQTTDRRQTDVRQTTDRQTTDGRTTTYSEHELEFTFAKNCRSAGLIAGKNWYRPDLELRLTLAHDTAEVIMCYGVGDKRSRTASVRWRSAVDWTTPTQLCRSSCRSGDHVGREAVLGREDRVEKTANPVHRENQVQILLFF